MYQAPAILESLWGGIDLDGLFCSHCGHEIDPDNCLARTLSLASLTPNTEPCSQRIDVPALSETITIYNRHLDCLFSSVDYVAISHVWHPEVADLQYRRGKAEASVSSVTRVVQEVAVKLCLGIAKGMGRTYEVWLDYISVPQWQERAKSQIIQQIPRIFGHSTATVAYLSDLDPKDVASMRHGKTIDEVSQAVSKLCNSKWFSRVWTMMEYTRSHTVRTVAKDFTLIQQPPGNEPLYPELRDTWYKQSRNQNLDTEIMVKMGRNLVPWQLGPLEYFRQLNFQEKLPVFAMAYTLLARRCLTIPRDFFHGLFGVLRLPDLRESDLSQEMTVALSQVAQRCLLRGDYSPLLMVPASSLRDPDEITMRSHGYQDMVVFSLGPEYASPTNTKVEFQNGNPTLVLENIGSVGLVKRLSGNQSDKKTLPPIFKLILENSGSNLHAFANTLARLYRIPAHKVIQHTGDPESFQTLLHQISSSKLKLTQELAETMAKDTGLLDEDRDLPMASVSPLAYLGGHGGTVHLENVSAIVGVDCHVCGERFLLRVALFQHESRLAGAEAYRVPGLRYRFSLPGGVGFLVKDKRIIGRFIWGTPTCECNPAGGVGVIMPDLPLPKPNTCQYGGSEWTEYLPLIVDGRFKF